MTTRLLNRMLSSLMGLPNPAWVSLGNVVSHMGPFTFDSQTLWRAKKSHFQPSVESGIKNIDKNNR